MAGALPGDPLRNFGLIAAVSVWATGVLLFYWLEREGFGETAAYTGLALYFGYGAATKLMLAGVIALDATSYVLVLLCLLVLQMSDGWRKPLLFTVLLALGATVKETTVLVGPLYYSLQARRWVDFRLGMQTALVMTPAIVLTVILRTMIPDWNDNDAYTARLGPQLTWVTEGTARYDLVTAFKINMMVYERSSAINLLRLFTYNSIGLLLFLPFFAWRRNRELLLRWTPYWAPVLASLLIALNADRRLSSLLFLLLPMGLHGLEKLGAALGFPASWWIPIFGLQVLLNLLQPLTPTVPFDLAAAVFLFSVGVAWNLRGGDRTRHTVLPAEGAYTSIPPK
jgi:hypothetical protein